MLRRKRISLPAAPSNSTSVIAVLLSAALPLAAHEPISTKLTWSREISRIVYKRCGPCHRPGGAAPMPLVTYEESRPWAKAIKEEVLERRMPPWGAVKGFGSFEDDQALTQEELHLIADWVEGGAPEGDPKYLPDPPGPAPSEVLRRPSGLTVSSAVTVRRSATLAGVRPLRVPKGASLRAIAVHPDGTIEPLLWLHNFDPRWTRDYRFREPVRLAAGSRILLVPPGTGTLLFGVRPANGARSPAR